jgi:hypothetical protein
MGMIRACLVRTLLDPQIDGIIRNGKFRSGLAQNHGSGSA